MPLLGSPYMPLWNKDELTALKAAEMQKKTEFESANIEHQVASREAQINIATLQTREKGRLGLIQRAFEEKRCTNKERDERQREIKTETLLELETQRRRYDQAMKDLDASSKAFLECEGRLNEIDELLKETVADEPADAAPATAAPETPEATPAAS